MPLPPNLFRPNSILLKRWEAITYFVRIAPGAPPTTNGYPLYRASRGNPDKKDTSPPLAKITVTWTLWRDDIEANGIAADGSAMPTPKVSDVIQDSDGVRWTVMSVGLTVDDNGYRLETLQER